jgi:hypothetical protein
MAVPGRGAQVGREGKVRRCEAKGAEAKATNCGSADRGRGNFVSSSRACLSPVGRFQSGLMPRYEGVEVPGEAGFGPSVRSGRRNPRRASEIKKTPPC